MTTTQGWCWELPGEPGEVILITGAAGSLGRFVGQLALQKRMRVFATSSQRQHARLLRLGVQVAADYPDDDWTASLRAAR